MNEELDAFIAELEAAGASDEEITAILDERLSQQEPSVVEIAAAGTGAFNRGISQVVSAPLKVLGAVEETLGGVGYLSQAGQAVEDFVTEYNPRYENVNETYQSVGEGLGQAAGMVASAGLGGTSALTQTATKVPGILPSLGKSLASKPAILGGSMTAAPEWEEAKAAGLSDGDAFEVLIKNYLIGQTEAVPIEKLLVGLNRITGGKILETVKLMGQQGITEGIQEGVQTYLTNMVAQDEYDPDRDPLFQVLESAKVGGIVGLILPGVMSIAKNLPADKKVKFDRKLGELQINEAIEQSDTGDPQLNAEIDAVAQIDPVDKEVLEEAKIAEAVVEEQAEVEKQEKLQEAVEEQNKPEPKEGEKKEEKPLKPSQTPEYKIALDKVTKLQEQFAALPIEENADQLLFDLREARQALQKIAGKPKDSRRKTDIQKQIEDVTGVTKPEKSVKMTPAEAIKQQVQTFYRGKSEGVKVGAEAKNDLVTKVQEAIKEYPLETKQVNSILSRLKRTNLFTPGSISRLNTFIDRVSQDAEYADKISEAQAINKKIRKLAKGDNLYKYKGLGKAFASINPEDTFINQHLEVGKKILAGLTTPKKDGYAPVNIEGAEEYITDLQAKIAEFEQETIPKQQEGEKRNVQLFSTLQESLSALNDKDLSEFDDSEVRTINSLKSLDSVSLTDEQAVSIVRVIDNIVENDDFSNSGTVESIVKSKEALKKLKEKYDATEKALIGEIGKVGANIYQQFTRIFGDSGIAADFQEQTGIMGMWNAGSRTENQEIKASKEYANKIKELNKKHKTKIQDLKNQVRLFALAELAKNYGDNSHITKVKGNISRSASEYEKSNPDQAVVWRDVYDEVKDITSVEEAVEQLKKYPALYEIWEFNKNIFKRDISSRLARTRSEVHNKPYLEADNYSHTEMVNISDTRAEKQQFEEGQANESKKLTLSEATTGQTATRNLPQGRAYSSDWIESQLRGYRKSLYDVESSRAKALVIQTIYTPEFEQLVGGLQNAKLIRSMVVQGERIQKGMSRGTANEAVKWINSLTQSLRNLGATRALGSLTQPVKQVPSVWTKAMFNHLGSGSLDAFFKGLSAINLISTSPNLRKLFDQYTVGVRGQRLGGIERGDAIGFRLSPGATQAAARKIEQIQGATENVSRVVLAPLTKSDTYAARTTWLGYYLQSLKEQGVTKVDLNNEYQLQEDQKRKTAAAFAEQMLAETQVPSNPATLAQIVRNENDGGWNFAKNILLPFSTFSLTAKYRNISDVSKAIRNPSARNLSAVAGDVVEIGAYAGIVYGLAAYYKDWLKSGIESLFGLTDAGDDEKDKSNRIKAFWGNITNSTLPFAVGSIGEYGVARMVNGLAYLAQNPDLSYQEWKKETGGFIFEPDVFDAGVFAIGLEPYIETVSGTIDLASDKATLNEFGRSKEVELTDAQENLLALKVLLDAGGWIGIGEADLYGQVKKILKEQMRGAETKPTTPRITPKPRPRPRPKPARQLQ